MIGIIGGTGFYSLFDSPDEHRIDTPYGQPSDAITTGILEGQEVAFLPRHGRKHEYGPATIPARANLWAMKSLGVSQILGFNSVGSTQPEYRRGDFALIDQFVDRTWGRSDSYFVGDEVGHVALAEPYCGRMRTAAYDALRAYEPRLHPTATVVVIQGPRFSTAAESRWFSEQGWHLVNMTQYPEVALAREQEICYANLSYVTDYDAALSDVVAGEDAQAVSHQEVINAFSEDVERVKAIVRTVVRDLPSDTGCACRSALAGATG